MSQLTVGFVPSLRLGVDVIRTLRIVAVVALIYASFLLLTVYSLGASRVQPAISRTAPRATESSVATQLPVNNDKAWVYDFSKLADGPLPATDWNIESGVQVADYNQEAQAYTPRTQNVRIQDGQLVIEARPELMYGRQYSSARINSLGKFDFTYGTLEVAMQLPRGVGTWPAAWLMPVSNKHDPAQYGVSHADPKAWVVNGEIDFLESIGRIPGQNIPAAHTYNQMRRGTLYTPGYVPNAYDQFHTYGVIKTPTDITFTIDGEPFATRTKTGNSPLDWPFDQPYYLILNLALGGDWAGAEGIDDASAPWLLKVKHIAYTPLS